MALLLKKLVKGYLYINEDLADPRTKSYLFVSSPLYTITILSLYLLFVLKWGPEFMKNRKPYNLNKVIMLFNVVQILACGFIVYRFMTEAFFNFNWRCEAIDYSTKRLPSLYAFYSWVYYMIKVVDLLDTVFFVLRKKFNQISFLHLYHHTGMVVATYIGVKYIAGGHGLIVGFVNCVVHVFMYFYYLISIWDEKYKKSIWWKKHITQLQICQFLFLTVIFGQILVQPDCTYPSWVVLGFLPQNVFMTCMFADFYYKAYISPRKIQPTQVNHDPKTVIKQD